MIFWLYSELQCLSGAVVSLDTKFSTLSSEFSSPNVVLEHDLAHVAVDRNICRDMSDGR